MKPAAFFGAGKHKRRAGNFILQVRSSASQEEWCRLMIGQVELLKNPENAPGGDQKYQQALQNNTVDEYHHIIARWANRFIDCDKPKYSFAEEAKAQEQSGTCIIA